MRSGDCPFCQRHEPDFLRLTNEEQVAVWALVPQVRRHIEHFRVPPAYNVGINAGAAAGQTIDRAHLHVIPRFQTRRTRSKGRRPVDHPRQGCVLGATVTGTDQQGAIAFAEKILELLEEGRYTATYKYAVLMALMDLCLEGTHASGAPPEMVTTRQLADKVVQVYWPHTAPFADCRPTTVLRQNTTGQAEIVSSIRRFRERYAQESSVPWWQCRLSAPKQYERLVKTVEWKLIEMPLPRLQTMGESAAAVHLPDLLGREHQAAGGPRLPRWSGQLVRQPRVTQAWCR